MYVIAGIRWGDDGIADVLLKLLILLVITFPISIWNSWDFMSLNLILNQNCNPVTYVQVMCLLEKVHKRKQSAVAIRINEEAIHKVQDQWIRPEDFEKWDWLRNGDYLVIMIENQGCCRVGIRKKDLAKKIHQFMWQRIR